MEIHHYIHLDPEASGLLRDLNRKLDSIMERTRNMATQEQVTKLTADVKALTDAIDALLAAKAQPTADPALDAVDQSVTAATAKITAALPPA